MIAVPFLYFTLLSIYLIRKNGGIDLCAFLVLIYAFSSLCAILINVFDAYEMNGVCEKMPISPFATFVYCLLLTLSILPFRSLRSHEITQINIQKPWLVDLLAWVLIITFFLSLFSIFSNLEVVLHSDLKDVREDVYDNYESEQLVGWHWLIAMPGTLLSQFSPIAIIIYYLNIAYNRKSLLFNFLVLLSSLTPVIKAVLLAGRTQPIYWFLSFIAISIIFRPMLTKEQRRRALLPFAVFGSIVGLFIAAVTIARFKTSGVMNDAGTFNSLIAYSGQSFINFNNFFCNYSAHDIHFDRLIPMTYYFLIDPTWTLDDYREVIWSYSGMNIGVFFTFLGDLLVDLGHIGMTIYVLLFSLISYLVCRKANQDGEITLSRLLVVLILFLIPLQGIFYYSYYKVNVSYFIVGTLLYCFILSHTIKKS